MQIHCVYCLCLVHQEIQLQYITQLRAQVVALAGFSSMKAVNTIMIYGNEGILPL